MALKKGLTESSQEEDVVSQVGECAVGLEYRHVARVEKVVDGWRGFRRNGDSVGCACCKDYLLGCWWEAVPTARFPVCFALCRNDRAVGFCVLWTRCDFTEDSCGSEVILWCGLVGGRLFFSLMSTHWWYQLVARLSACSDSGATCTRGALRAIA